MGQQIQSVFLAGEEDEVIAGESVLISQLAPNLVGPVAAVGCRHVVEREVIGLDDVVQVKKMVFGGEDVNGIGFEDAGVGQT